MYSSEIADLEQFIDSYVGPESRTSSGDWAQARLFEEKKRRSPETLWANKFPSRSSCTASRILFFYNHETSKLIEFLNCAVQSFFNYILQPHRFCSLIEKDDHSAADSSGVARSPDGYSQNVGTEFWGEKPGGKEWGAGEQARNIHWNEHKPKIEQRDNQWQQNFMQQPDLRMAGYGHEVATNPEFQHQQPQNPTEIQAIVSDLIRQNNMNKTRNLPPWVDVTRPPPFFPPNESHPSGYPDQYIQEQEKIVHSMTFRRSAEDNADMMRGNAQHWRMDAPPAVAGAYPLNTQGHDWSNGGMFYSDNQVNFRPPSEIYSMPQNSYPPGGAHSQRFMSPPEESQRFQTERDFQRYPPGIEQSTMPPPLPNEEVQRAENARENYPATEQVPNSQGAGYAEQQRRQQHVLRAGDDSVFRQQLDWAHQPQNIGHSSWGDNPPHQTLPGYGDISEGRRRPCEDYGQLDGRLEPPDSGDHRQNAAKGAPRIADVDTAQAADQNAPVSHKPPQVERKPKEPSSAPSSKEPRTAQRQTFSGRNYSNSKLHPPSNRQPGGSPGGRRGSEKGDFPRSESDHSRSGSEVFENETDDRWRTHNFKVHVSSKQNHRRRSSAADDDMNWRRRGSVEEKKQPTNNRHSSSDSDHRSQKERTTKKGDARKPDSSGQRSVASTGKSRVQSWIETGQDAEETGKRIDLLDISGSDTDLNKFIETTQAFATNENKMREVAEILCNKALKNPRFARNASLLCDRMAWMMVEGTKFRSVVLNVMQGHYRNREQLFASSFRSDGRWFGFVAFLTEIFLNVRTTSRERLIVLVEPVFACLLQVLNSKQVDRAHIESFGNLFSRAGAALEKESPSRMNELLAEIRDRCVIAKTVHVRRVLLGCVELYATKWRTGEETQAS